MKNLTILHLTARTVESEITTVLNEHSVGRNILLGFLLKFLTAQKTNFTEFELFTTFRSQDMTIKIFLKNAFSSQKFCQVCQLQTKFQKASPCL